MIDNFTIAGPAFLGETYAPFSVTGDPNSPNFRVPNIGLADAAERERFAGRAEATLFAQRPAPSIDRSASAAGMDTFQKQAVNLLTSAEAARAFDLNLESPKVRERYGRHRGGSNC